MEKTLKDFSPNEKGVVKKISAEGKIKRRLFDMGITPGARIIMRKAAPLGDPIEVNVRGYELSLRKDEAAQIVMCECEMHMCNQGGRAGKRLNKRLHKTNTPHRHGTCPEGQPAIQLLDADKEDKKV